MTPHKIPLKELNGAECLPEKRECSRHYNPSPNICDCGAKGRNQTIDELSGVQLEFDLEGLVETLINGKYAAEESKGKTYWRLIAEHLATNHKRFLKLTKGD